MRHRFTTTISALCGHKAIAWDFDDTLVGHPNAPIMHRFIAQNPHLRHVIVTFRTHGMQDRIFDELGRYRTAPPESAFEAVINISDRRWEDFHKKQKQNISYAFGLSPEEKYYLEWKGMVCRDNGLTVLVDDDTENVRLGCERYHIVHLHPDDVN